MNTREKVLETLEKNNGKYVSGETLAKDCGVSRNAVWKSIAELKKAGYAVSSVNNRGYMLEESSDIISGAGIRACLEDAADGRTYDAGFIVFDELDSTNNEAKRSLLFNDDRVVHGTVIIAKRQTNGRGHGGSSFSSPEGGIYLSIILEPSKIKNEALPVTEAAAGAVRAAIESLYHVKTTKKKDSSLYVGREKVCGILTEGISDLETGEYSNYIIGTGIDAEKLKAATGADPKKNLIIAEIIKNLNI